jgi:AraC-like DNA-binding protein
VPTGWLHTVFDAALRGCLLALLLLLAGVLLRDRSRLLAARLGAALLLGLCVQVIGATPLFEAQVSRFWQAPFVAVSVGNAVLFWVFLQSLFDDAFVLRPLHIAAWLGVAVLSGLNCAVLIGSGWAWAPLSVTLQRYAPALFAVLAAWAALSHWQADLVEPRRRLRGFIATTGIAYTLVMVAARVAAPQGRLSEAAAGFDVVLMLLMMAVLGWWLLQLHPSELFPSVPEQDAQGSTSTALAAVPAGTATSGAKASPTATPATPAPAHAHAHADAHAHAHAHAHAPTPTPEADAADARLAESLQRLMQVEQAYRREDLSVASLAALLKVPEYRLRRLINQRLGHRNFTAFVNGWRLDEARTALADPARSHLPVLTIALTAGFQSIGPFNRAFKTATGQTPTEFRQQHRTDS